MTYQYTTPAMVRAELRATQDFSASTYPTADQLATWIVEESDVINNFAGRTFGSTAYSETIDYSGEEILTLKNAPLISVTSLLYSSSELGSDTYSLSDTKVLDEDYTVYADEGEIALLSGFSPSIGRKRLQINYTAGYSTTPLRVQMLATKRVTKRIMDSLLEKDVNEKQSGKSVSVGSISIVKPADFGVAQYRTITQDIDKLTQEILNGPTAYRIGGHRF